MWGPGDFGTDLSASADRDRSNNALTAAHRVAQQNGDLYEQMAEGNAANLAHRYALHEQLRDIDPSNPLLTNKLLVERLQDAGTAAYRIAGNNFDAAREVGRTFVIPVREKKILQPPVLMKNEAADLKLAYAGGLAQRHALAAELRRLDPTNPLLTDAALIERIRNAGGTAYTMQGGDMAAAREVGDTFNVPRG
jgi:uncharacterized protein involved in outer membrane biogenesis